MSSAFGDPLTRRAMVETALLGAACGPLGVWVLLHRQAFAAESLSHGLLPGVVLAALAGAPLVLGAAGGVVVAAAAIALAGRDERVGSDAGVAIAVGALFGAGALLALAPDSPPRLEELLFGDPLGATTGDLVASGALAVAAVTALAVLHRRLTLTAFDRAAAASLGAAPARAELALLAVLAAVTVAGAPALGNLLLVALVLGPATAALATVRRVPAALLVAAALAVAAGVGGLAASYALDTAAGASVALCAIIPVLAATFVGKGRTGRQRT